MKNVLVKTILASSLVTSSMFAEGLFVGGEFGYQQSKIGDLKDNVPALGLKAGYDFDMYRVYGEYKYSFEGKDTLFDPYHYKKTKFKTHDILIGADFTPSITDNFKFVVGAFGGYSKIKAKGIVDEESSSYSENGWKIGAKVGGIYGIDNNNEVEFGVKADYAKYSDDKLKTYGAYIGYNYKF